MFVKRGHGLIKVEKHWTVSLFMKLVMGVVPRVATLSSHFLTSYTQNTPALTGLLRDYYLLTQL
jgi:hypothetical protein